MKVAILEFLKRSCPKDTELFTIVALHFRMYNEIASMWHTEAKLIVSKLVDEARKEFGLPISFSATEIKFVKNEQTEKVLNVAMTNFTHATQYYLQVSNEYFNSVIRFFYYYFVHMILKSYFLFYRLAKWIWPASAVSKRN